MLSKISVKKPVTVIMITLIFIIFGVVSFTNLSTDLFPSMNLPIAAVSTVYTGASPEEIETIVSAPLESTLATVENVENITSISNEHSSLIIVEFSDSTDMDVAMLELREKIDMAKASLPEDVQNPMIMKFNPNMMPIMVYSLTQDGKNMAEVTDFVQTTLKPRLERLEGVASVTIEGGSEQQILVNLDSNKINMLGLDKETIKNILMAQNFNFPVGNIKEEGKDYSIRAVGEFNNIQEISDLVIFEMPVPLLPDGTPMDVWSMLEMMKAQQGANSNNQLDISSAIQTNPQVPASQMGKAQIKLSDIADVEYVEKNSNVYSKVNGEDSITVSIQKQNNYNTTDVSKVVEEEISNIKMEFQETNVVTLLDQSEYINRMVGSVSRNAIVGAILAVIILLIFLKDLRPTIIIGIAIPISVIVAFTAVWLADITLNVVSLGGLALGIGMLVDNAVVVLENIYRLRKEGKSRAEAAVEGSKQVSGAIIASTLTTIAVFLPVVFVEGFTAQIFQEMALTVSITLLASLLVALTLVPMMSSKLIKRPDTSTHHKLMDKSKESYKKLLSSSLKHKWIVVAITIIVFGGSILGALSVGTELMPEADEGQISINVTMPKGTVYEDTIKEVGKIEDALLDYEEIDVIGASVGGNDMFSMLMGSSADTGSITVMLVDQSDRERSTKEVADEIREELSQVSDAEINVEATSANMMTMAGTGVQVDITGLEFDVLEDLAKEVADIVENVEGTVEVDDGIEKGSPEVRIVLDEEKALPMGLTTAQVAGQIREMLTGIKATTINMKGRTIDVYVNETANENVSIESIESLPFNTPMGGEVVLGNVANIEKATGYTSITRSNQKRMLSVTGKIKEGYASGTVSKDIEEALEDVAVPDGYNIDLTGQAEQIEEAFGSLLLALILGAVLVYMIMASQFESLLYPFVIMFSVPLAFTGAFLGLFITGTPLSIVAFLGMIVLTGIVVNNGIVLIDYINQLKEQGLSTKEAILEAGPTRLRPIMMTALTTILGLLPIALGIGEGAEMITPLGITVIGGLIMSTFLTLIVVPIIYSIFDSIKNRVFN